MLAAISLPSQPTATAGAAHIGALVTRTAVHDRMAFRRLYAFLAMSVWHMAAHRLPNPHDAAAVTRSTFVEVWHLARHCRTDAGGDARAWVTAIAAGRVDDRTRIRTGPGIAVDDYDARIRRELRDLLGRGRAVVRSAPHTFINVDDLDDAITAIAAAVGSSNISSVRLTAAVAPGPGRCC
jgi:DNA-directed RNA polymerase specialized sigma24 family protein